MDIKGADFLFDLMCNFTFLLCCLMRTRPSIVLDTTPAKVDDPLTVEIFNQEFENNYNNHPQVNYSPEKENLVAMSSIAFADVQKGLYLKFLPPFYPANFKADFIKMYLAIGPTKEPIVVNVDCILKDFKLNSSSGKQEIEMYVNDAQFIYGITELVENIRAYFNETSKANTMSVVVKHPIYKEVMTAGWFQHYGKYRPICLQKPDGQSIAFETSDISKLESMLQDEAPCKVRIYLTIWGRIDRDKNQVIIGFKPYVQGLHFI